MKLGLREGGGPKSQTEVWVRHPQSGLLVLVAPPFWNGEAVRMQLLRHHEP